MKDKFTRDQQRHNEYKEKLKEESRRIYNIEKCWASHKPYKGLIASHIKPYKLCVLDNDTYSEYNTNNGLLLSKTIDDYFDKLLITFDENGKIICSDKVDGEIQQEFYTYSLDECIFNEERKQYMRIHRALFYYKHYYTDSIPANLKLDSIKLPFFNCGIRHFNNNIIILKDFYWYVCDIQQLKQEFIARTNYKFKYYISGADFANVFLRTTEYAIDCEISSYLNTPSETIDVEHCHNKITENVFKISSTNVNINNNVPEKFLQFLCAILHENTEIEKFKKIINIALQGNGYSKGIVLYGDIQNINLLISILKAVFGNYIYNYSNTKILYKNNNIEDIPNCCIMLYQNHNFTIEQYNWNRIVDNTCFSTSVLRINKFIPIVTINSTKQFFLQNAIHFKISSTFSQFNIDEIIDKESGAILNWFINANTLSLQDFESLVCEDKILATEVSINNWLHYCCEFDEKHSTEEKAKDLYANYKNFSESKKLTPVSERYFFIQINKIFQKKRYGFGMVYIGIRLKSKN